MAARGQGGADADEAGKRQPTGQAGIAGECQQRQRQGDEGDSRGEGIAGRSRRLPAHALTEQRERRAERIEPLQPERDGCCDKARNEQRADDTDTGVLAGHEPGERECATDAKEQAEIEHQLGAPDGKSQRRVVQLRCSGRRDTRIADRKGQHARHRVPVGRDDAPGQKVGAFGLPARPGNRQVGAICLGCQARFGAVGPNQLGDQRRHSLAETEQELGGGCLHHRTFDRRRAQQRGMSMCDRRRAQKGTGGHDQAAQEDEQARAVANNAAPGQARKARAHDVSGPNGPGSGRRSCRPGTRRSPYRPFRRSKCRRTCLLP
jgi:hypothetical protein